MLFNIEVDQGAEIVGYLVPDDFTGAPRVQIKDGERTLALIACNEERAALVSAGRHATGRCGFRIDESTVPMLAMIGNLELYDADTGILIYRRRHPAQVVHERVFRLETHLLPLWRLDDQIESKFQYFHKGIERHGRETATQIFLLNNATSLYLSGRLSFRAYEHYIQDDFRCVMLMHNPYVELAERLLTLKHVGRFGEDLLGSRDMIAFRAAIEFSERLQMDERALQQAFKTMPKAAIVNFANPVVRQLTANSLEEPAPRGAIATALDVLSSFAIVGLREKQHLFLEELEALLDLQPGTLPQLREVPRNIEELAGCLVDVPEVEMLIEQDLEVFETVRSVLEATSLTEEA